MWSGHDGRATEIDGAFLSTGDGPGTGNDGVARCSDGGGRGYANGFVDVGCSSRASWTNFSNAIGASFCHGPCSITYHTTRDTATHTHGI